MGRRYESQSNVEMRQNSYCRFVSEKQDVYSLASFLSVSRAKTLAIFAGSNKGFYQVSIDEVPVELVELG